MNFWKRRKIVPDQTEKNVPAAVTEEQEETAETAAVLEPEEDMDWQARYEAEHAELVRFREETASAEVRRRKEEAYLALLGECGIPESKRRTVLRLCDTDAVVLGEDGRIEQADALRESIVREWYEIIPSGEERRCRFYPAELPPLYRSEPLTKEMIMAIRDRDARRSAILENIELFR